MKPERKKIGIVVLAGIACGSIVWGLSVPLTGMREPFDAPGLYYIAATFTAGVLATLPAPRYWWAAVIGVFLGEQIYAFVMLPETRLWLLFGILMHVLMLTWVPKAVGALIVYIVSLWLAKRRRKNA
jgi:hypothetical protein